MIKPEPTKLVIVLQCLLCPGSAEMLYKGTSYCRKCLEEFRRTHIE